MNRALQVAASAVLVLLSCLLAVWGAFLVPLRVSGQLVPVAPLLALVGTAVVVRAALRTGGRPAGGAAAAAWVGTALLLGSARSEGDVVIAQGATGLAYLVLGCGAAAVSYASGAGTPPRATPGAGAGRRRAGGEHRADDGG